MSIVIKKMSGTDLEDINIQTAGKDPEIEENKTSSKPREEYSQEKESIKSY